MEYDLICYCDECGTAIGEKEMGYCGSCYEGQASEIEDLKNQVNDLEGQLSDAIETIKELKEK